MMGKAIRRRLVLAGSMAFVCACVFTGCAFTTSHSNSSTSVSSATQDATPDASNTSVPASSAGTQTSPGATTSTISPRNSALTNETAPSVDSIRTAAYNALHASGADASVTYIDLKSGATFSLDGGNSRSSASVIKLLVLAALLDSVHAGTHTLDESLTVSNADMVGGTGVISDMGVGDYTLRSLATYMITDSDNVATNKIIGLLGMENINAEAAQLGLPNTRLERLMMDEAAIAAISAAVWDARI